MCDLRAAELVETFFQISGNRTDPARVEWRGDPYYTSEKSARVFVLDAPREQSHRDVAAPALIALRSYHGRRVNRHVAHKVSEPRFRQRIRSKSGRKSGHYLWII